jgi:cob(I)alamin adenosyltransferase
MPKITRVYTRSGDDGSTALTGGDRVSKGSPRVELYGTVDELNAAVGVAIAQGVSAELAAPLATIQNELFHLGAELSVPGARRDEIAGPRVDSEHVRALEELMDRLSADLSPLENFVLPGGSPAGAQLHVARTICRRAERLAVSLSSHEPVAAEALAYLNRLSDALFVMARWENGRAGVADTLWQSRR